MALINANPVAFELGLTRTPEDVQGGQVTQYWADAFHIQGIPSNDVTAFVGLLYRADSKVMSIAHLQATRLTPDGEHHDGQAGARIRKAREGRWAYPGRFEILAALAGVFGAALGATTIELPRPADPHHCGLATHKRSVQFNERIASALRQCWSDLGLAVQEASSTQYWHTPGRDGLPADEVFSPAFPQESQLLGAH